jgi:hypothetical protein
MEVDDIKFIFIIILIYLTLILLLLINTIISYIIPFTYASFFINFNFYI